MIYVFGIPLVLVVDDRGSAGNICPVQDQIYEMVGKRQQEKKDSGQGKWGEDE